jgi:general stress protein YciG
MGIMVKTKKATEKTDATPAESKPKTRRGFASMDRAQVRELASRGGRAAHEQGTAHEFTPEEARAAGRKGGLASHRPRAEKA